MEQNDFYEVDGCMDFIPVKIVGKSEDGVIVTHTNDKRDCKLVVEEVYRLLKPHEPQKPVIPKFVAEWYERNKDCLDPAIYSTITGTYRKVDGGNNDLLDMFETWLAFEDNSILTLVRVHLFGYEIEQEKLYTVEIPNPNGDTIRYGLCKVDGRIIIGSFVFGLDRATNAKLTEAEIKQDFDFLWKFAKEVDND